jgi:hypothetical protein
MQWLSGYIGCKCPGDIPSAPLILVGAFSAAKIGTVEPLAPIPSPITTLEKQSDRVSPDTTRAFLNLPTCEQTLPGLGETRTDGSCDQT